jgi:hypothetical protein
MRERLVLLATAGTAFGRSTAVAGLGKLERVYPLKRSRCISAFPALKLRLLCTIQSGLLQKWMTAHHYNRFNAAIPPQ